MKKWQQIQLFNLTAFVLGLALTFAFAPYEIFPLAIVSLAGLLALWLNRTPKEAFWLGFWFGAGFFGLGVYWVFISVHYIGEVPTPLAVPITGALIAYMALFPALVGYALNRYFPSNNLSKMVCAFPALWVFSEWVRSWLFTGFAWLLVGYTQTNSPLKGYAPVFSVYGISLAVTITAAMLVFGIRQYKAKNYRSIYFSLFAIVAIWTMGSMLNLISWTKPHGDPITISLVQGNIPQEIKWSSDTLQLSFDRYRELTEPLWGKSKIIIWPETAIPMTLQGAADYIQSINDKAKESNTQLILGIPIQRGKGYYNAVVTLGKEQRVYVKRHLVPFGEYVPISKWIERMLNAMDIPTSVLLPGNIKQPFIQIDGLKIATSICYEITFPELILSDDKTIDMLLTVTNDAWFGRSAAQAQHLQMAAMRALELRRPVIAVSNDGITAVIGPDGKIEAQAPPYETYVLNATVQPTNGLTPWMRNGMDPVLFFLVALILVALRAKKRILLSQEKPDADLPQKPVETHEQG